MGAKLVDKDLGFREWFKRAKELKDARVHVGVLQDGKGGAEAVKGSKSNIDTGEARVTLHQASGSITLAELAAILEYGTEDGRIPSRPAFQMTFDEERERLVELGKKLIESFLKGRTSLDKALGVMGSTFAAAVKKKITGGPGIPPPNAPATVEAKGSSRPWVDTGRLVGAISWAVHLGGSDTE